MLRAGLVSIDQGKKWIGGRYYLHHLVKCASQLPTQDRVELREVAWGALPADDMFSDVRPLLGKPIVVAPPSTLVGRVIRKIRRLLWNTPGASDLFTAQGVDVLFPIPACENGGTPYVFWLPDFQYLRRPDLMSEDLRAHLEQYFREHVHAAARIVLSSEDARADFSTVYPEFLDKTHVVRFCSVPDEEWWQLDPREVAAKHGLPDRFLIVCNQFTRHKNHLVLMQAIKAAADAGVGDLHLVCTGSTFDHRGEDYAGQVQAYLKRENLEQRVRILGLVPRAEQIALLRRAVAVVQPSAFEGWSTIVEDAKTLGKPVFVSDLPVHREQLGSEQSWYLGIDSPQQWAEAIFAAWPGLPSGPSASQESQGMTSLNRAQLECASAFVQALRAAVPGRN